MIKLISKLSLCEPFLLAWRNKNPFFWAGCKTLVLDGRNITNWHGGIQSILWGPQMCHFREAGVTSLIPAWSKKTIPFTQQNEGPRQGSLIWNSLYCLPLFGFIHGPGVSNILLGKQLAPRCFLTVVGLWRPVFHTFREERTWHTAAWDILE